MTLKRVCVSCAIVLAAFAIALFRVSASDVDSSSPTVIAQDVVAEPKSTIGIRSVMAVVIKEVLPGSAAEQAGLREGDLVTYLDEQIESLHDFRARIGNSEPGTSFRIRYQRFNRTTGAWDELQGTIQTKPFRPFLPPGNSFVKVAFR